MRFGWMTAGAILWSGLSFAGTINDIFGQPQNNCILTYTPPYSTCDVVGNELLYDIQKATVSFANGTATVAIYMNTGAIPYGAASLTLASFHDAGDTLIPGDIFFYDPDTIGNPAFGIPLIAHGAFLAGDLYDISDGISTEDAQAVLRDGSDFYRWDETVLMTGSGNPESTGSIKVSKYGNGITGAEYDITATVPLTPGLLDLESNGEIGLLFSSADCGNDVIEGVVSTADPARAAVVSNVPESGPGVLTLTGLVLLVIGGQWKKRTR